MREAARRSLRLPVGEHSFAASLRGGRRTRKDPTLRSAPKIPVSSRPLFVRRATLTRGVALLSLCLTLFAAIPPLEAQLFERATVIENVTLRLDSDRVIRDASIVIRGGRVTAIGSGVEKPMLSRAIDGGGGFITAGAIATASQLALDPSRRASPQSRAWDGFDRYDEDAMAIALSGGVTTVCLIPRGPAGVVGIASIVRLALRAEGGLGKVLEEEAALCLELGSSNSSLARLRTLTSIQKQFQAAVDYRESRDLYEDDLEDYLKELEKRANKDEKPEKGSPRGRPPSKGKAAPKNASAKAADKNEKDDPPKKPKEPRPRPDLEILLRAIDRELPVRVHAETSADILNAIALADRFGFRLTLVGASEAHLLLEEIAEAEATVLIGPGPSGRDAERGVARRRPADLPARLTAAGIPWAMVPGEHLQEILPEAQTLIAATGGDPLRAITRDAARLLGLPRIGALGRGVSADLVLWSGDPITDPAARVRQVWVEGTSVFRSSLPAAKPTDDGEKREAF